jgi:hypothetical protein
VTVALVFYETAAEFERREGEDAAAYWGAWSAYIDLLADAEVLVRGKGGGLQSPTTAKGLRIRNGERVIQDGPIPDSKEQLGGMVFLNVRDWEEAVSWAERAPCAHTGVEIRPVLDPNPE